MAEDKPAGPAASSQQSHHRQNSKSAEFHDSVFTNLGDPLSLVYKNLTYTIKIREVEPVDEEKEEARKWYQFTKRPKKKTVEKVILDDLTGIFRPGRLTAIMGASGAGKTSLLSVLAGQVNATYVNGTILINDDDFSESGQMQEISGFVFQDDVLLPSMKVKEAIKMSALLRLPESVTKEERVRRVDEIIQILHLKKAAKTEVGNPLKKGISGGERKRTSIAMEIITNPAMLFLDEPTSGLDTFTAYTVCKALQNLAHRQGRTIVATIHQPSSDIFYLFDDLLILAEGRIAYYGPTEGCIEYFSDLGYPCPQYSNPADYIFMNILSDIDGKTATTPIGSARSPSTTSRARRRETRPVSWIPSGITESSEQRIQRVLEYWPNSPECEKMTELLEHVPVKGVGTLSYKGRASYWTQFMFLMGRASKNAIRNPMIVRVRLFQSIFIGLLLGLIYMNQNQYPIGQQIQNRAGVLFFIAVNQYFAAANQILAVFYEEKTVFFREFQAGYYRLSAYYWTKIIVEVHLYISRTQISCTPISFLINSFSLIL
jgi:ATP-binding cassette subfamily G (WHITE) protein 1